MGVRWAFDGPFLPPNSQEKAPGGAKNGPSKGALGFQNGPFAGKKRGLWPALWEGGNSQKEPAKGPPEGQKRGV